MELLAPAGSRESLVAAVNSGADAVYLGYTAFSARAGAGNFDEAGLREAVALCHLHHVRVRVTVNILIKEKEFAQVREVLALLDSLWVDAVIVQDLGVAALCRAEFPRLRVFASTQMCLHNAAGARFAKAWGFDRVVMARECALQEMALAAREGIDVEAFAHGALCVCQSGQCLFSSLVGGRSGNRGRCAQPCRLPYSLGTHRGALLSPRDLMLRDHLDKLAKAGVTSLKIEGRLKRPEYVATVTHAYRRALDALQAGRFQPAGEGEREALLQIFNRGGFTPGYALGMEDAGIIEPRRVNHGGVPLGRVTQVKGGFAHVALARPLGDGDGLQFRGRRDTDALYAGPPVPAGGTARIRLRPDSPVRPGDEAVRLTSQAQMAEAAGYALPPIPVDMTLAAYPGKPLTLTLTDGETCVTVAGETASPAQTQPLTAQSAQAALQKTGETPFAPGRVTVETANAFAPRSALNALRREGLDALAKARAAAFACREALPAARLPRREPSRLEIRQAVITRTGRERGDLTLCQPEDYTLETLAVPQGAWLMLPPQCGEGWLHALKEWLGAHPVAGIALGSIGQIGMDWPVPVAAGPGVPIMNRAAAQAVYDWGCAFAFASPELTGRELEDLAGYPLLVVTYGVQRLMVLNHCPARTALGLKAGHAACRLCDENAPGCLRGQALTDRRGERFPLLRTRVDTGCLVGVYNSRTLDLRAQEEGLRALGFIPAHSLTGLENDQTTAGHWTRPVA